MGYETMDKVMRSRRYSGAKKAVLVAIARFSQDPKGDNAYPSVSTLVAFTGRSRSTVKRALADLETNGAVIKVQPGGGRFSTTYDLNLDALKADRSHHDRGHHEPPGGSQWTPRGSISAQNGSPIHYIEENGKEFKTYIREPQLPSLIPAGSKTAPAAFEVFWSTYPHRAGSNPRPAAADAWDARVSEGVGPADIIAGAERYAAFARSGNPPTIGTRWIMKAAKFLDLKESGWTQEWKPEVHHPKLTDMEIEMMRACADDRAAEEQAAVGEKTLGNFIEVEVEAIELFPPARRRVS